MECATLMLASPHRQMRPRSEYSGSGSDLSRGAGAAGSIASGSQAACDGPPRKLVILGLPYFTTDETLHGFFSQLGEVEEALVMRDHASGRSRGFGFVTFRAAEDAARSAGKEYSVDGRRCEAKFALPRGESAAQRVTRIFVAKLPPSVAEDDLRSYFSQFGTIQDVYMPKDASKQARRGIGFVTFATPDAVDRVIRQHHVMNGQEVVVDKAAPKLKEPAAAPFAGIAAVAAGPGALYRQPSSAQMSTDRLGAALGGGAYGRMPPGPASYQYGQHHASNGGLQQQHLLSGSLGGSLGASASSLHGYDSYSGMNGGQDDSNGELNLSDASVQLAIAQLARAQQAAQLGLSLAYDGRSGSALNLCGQGGRPSGAPGSANSLTDLDRIYSSQALPSGLPNNIAQQLRAPQTTAGSIGSPVGGRAMSGAAGEANGQLCTNRIFIGKLSKEVMETDIKDYCSKFGYVLDVYIPRDKNNKREHRGFGFVTFETEAAVDRILAFDDHQINGCAIAVDRALPRQEDTSQSVLSGDSYGGGVVVDSDAVHAAIGMAALGLGQIPGPARHNNDRSRYMYQPY